MNYASYFKASDLKLDNIFRIDQKFTAIAGAGISMDSSSCLLSARQIVKYLIDICCPNSEKEKILGLEGLRYELIIGGIERIFDKNLNFIYFLLLFNK
ncbi:MAG: hypothetical protein ACTSRZ_17925 [Promethearchaeota archaeon]